MPFDCKPIIAGKKIINFSNYSLNADNIINNAEHDDETYRKYQKDGIFNYQYDYINDMKDQLSNHDKYTQQLKKIHPRGGSYH